MVTVHDVGNNPVDRQAAWIFVALYPYGRGQDAISASHVAVQRYFGLALGAMAEAASADFDDNVRKMRASIAAQTDEAVRDKANIILDDMVYRRNPPPRQA